MSGGGGLFVVFEGGDGAGKTTQTERLCSWLGSIGVVVVRTLQPGGTPAGRRIRELLLDPATGDLAPRAEALLYAADKAQHVAEVIRPALEAGRVVVCDRYVDSMIAYQGAGRELEPGEMAQLATWATGGLRPQLTVILDVDPADAVGTFVERDRLEAAGDSFHERVRRHFLALAEGDPDRYLVLNGRASRDEIASAVRDRVARELSEVSGTLGR